MARRDVREVADSTVVRFARHLAWPGSPAATSLVTSLEALPFSRMSVDGDSLRSHAYALEGDEMMKVGSKGNRRGEDGGDNQQILPAGLSRVNLAAAGIDVGADSHFAAVPEDRCEAPVREFKAYTGDLYGMARWLAECGIKTVAMESTGVYWIPLFGVLEERGFEVMLVDPRRIKNVPGRKTDVLDCQWIQQLHTYGLLSGAFRPDAEIRSLQSYMRQRAMLVEYAAHHIQHMQKALTQMNVKIQHVIRDITGKTGLAIVDAIVSGKRDPLKLARLRDPRIRADETTIVRSLQGHWRDEHIFELTQALELYRMYQSKIAECDRKLEAQLGQFENRGDGEPPLRKPNRSRVQKNAPKFDVKSHLYRMTGGGFDSDRWRGRPHRTEGGQRDRAGHEPVAHVRAFRILAGTESEQPNYRRQDHQIQDHALGDPVHHCPASCRQRAPPFRQRPGRVPAQEEDPPGITQGHHRHGSQAGKGHLLNSQVRPGVHGRRSRVLRNPVPPASPENCEAQG